MQSEERGGGAYISTHLLLIANEDTCQGREDLVELLSLLTHLLLITNEETCEGSEEVVGLQSSLTYFTLEDKRRYMRWKGRDCRANIFTH